MVRRMLSLALMVLMVLLPLGLGHASEAPNLVKNTKMIHLKTFSFSPQGQLPSLPKLLDKSSYGSQEKGLFLVQFNGRRTSNH